MATGETVSEGALESGSRVFLDYGRPHGSHVVAEAFLEVLHGGVPVGGVFSHGFPDDGVQPDVGHWVDFMDAARLHLRDVQFCSTSKIAATLGCMTLPWARISLLNLSMARASR